jgi:hypothetical protein
MRNEFMYTLLNIEKAINLSKKHGHSAFQVEVTTSNHHPVTDVNYYYVTVDDANKIYTYIRYIMNFLFDDLGYTGHDVDSNDISDGGEHSMQITVRF